MVCLKRFLFKDTVVPVKVEQEAGYNKTVVHPVIIRPEGIADQGAGDLYQRRYTRENRENIFHSSRNTFYRLWLQRSPPIAPERVE